MLRRHQENDHSDHSGGEHHYQVDDDRKAEATWPRGAERWHAPGPAPPCLAVAGGVLGVVAGGTPRGRQGALERAPNEAIEAHVVALSGS